MMCLFIEGGGASASAESESGATVATETDGQVSKIDNRQPFIKLVLVPTIGNTLAML